MSYLRTTFFILTHYTLHIMSHEISVDLSVISGCYFQFYLLSLTCTDRVAILPAVSTNLTITDIFVASNWYTAGLDTTGPEMSLLLQHLFLRLPHRDGLFVGPNSGHSPHPHFQSYQKTLPCVSNLKRSSANTQLQP